ncbi:hypothetical protein COU78_04950 [Candidatus Peregrinibacteria bacterium CG10_big_fil_rev_8_21_14_0_10_49_24]|nr:MAG: hypothetical protein COU78_04950 [Candidatus Peregrinibacteria bacterium CG10_big_fil_rev_8_21_14_0_10_49_24]
MSETDASQQPNKIVVAIFAVVVVLLSLNFLGKSGSSEKIPEPPKDLEISITEEEITERQEPAPVQEFKKLKEAGKYVKLNYEDIVTPKFPIGDKEESNRIANEFLLNNPFRVYSDGTIKGGYLYLRAIAGYPASALSEKESVYIYLHSPEKGGHLFKPQSLIAELSSSGESEYLYSLQEVAVTKLPYSNKNTFIYKNWLEILQTEGSYFLGTFVSANRYAAIKEIGFAYDSNPNALSVISNNN